MLKESCVWEGGGQARRLVYRDSVGCDDAGATAGDPLRPDAVEHDSLGFCPVD